MENKELNKKIYFELLDLAKKQFKGLDLPDGHYTAKDVYKTLVERLETEEKEVTDKNGVTDTIKVYTKESLQKTEFEEINICIGSFKCRIKNALGLFQALSGYEKLCGCSGAKAYIFQVEKEKSGKITNTITFEIPTSKEWNALKKCTCIDNLRPVLNGIFADAENKNLVSTDGIVLYICNADISGDRNILIPLDICKKLKSGKVTVSIYEEYEKETEENYTVNGIICSRTNKETITPVKVENNGLSYTFEDKGLRYPDYIKVANYNEVDKDSCINIDIKEFEKTAKQCAKLVPAYCPLQLHAEKSTSGLEMGVKHEYPKIERRTQIDANNTPGRSITFGLELEQLLKILPVCSGNIYYKDHSRAVIFDAVNNGTLLIMPRLIDNSIFEDTGIIKDEFETPALERFEKYGYDTYMKPKKKAKAKKVSIITNEEKEAAKSAKAVETVEPEKPSFDYSKAAKNIINGLINKNTLLVRAYKELDEQIRNEEAKAIRPKETAINDIKNEEQEPDATELLPEPPKWIYYVPVAAGRGGGFLDGRCIGCALARRHDSRRGRGRARELLVRHVYPRARPRPRRDARYRRVSHSTAPHARRPVRAGGRPFRSRRRHRPSGRHGGCRRRRYGFRYRRDAGDRRARRTEDVHEP